jgi:hypothetical protein
VFKFVEKKISRVQRELQEKQDRNQQRIREAEERLEVQMGYAQCFF